MNYGKSMSKVSNSPVLDKVISGRRPIKKRISSKHASINFFNAVKKINLELTGTKKTYSKTVDSRSSKLSSGDKKNALLLRFSNYTLKMLFAKDLLKMLEMTSVNEKTDNKHFSNIRKEGGEPHKQSDGKSSKPLISNNLSQKQTNDELLTLLKEKLTSIQEKFKDFSNQSKFEKTSLQKLLLLVKNEINSFSSNVKTMPKIRLELILSQLARIQASVEKEANRSKMFSKTLKITQSLSQNKKGEVKEGKSLLFSKSHITGAQRAFSLSIALYQSLLELKLALKETNSSSIFTRGINTLIVPQRVFLPFGIVYPFTTFKNTIYPSKAKKKKDNQLEEEEQEEDLLDDKKDQ